MLLFSTKFPSEIAAALALAISRATTDLRQYINSDHAGFSDLNPSDGGWSQNPMETVFFSICPFCTYAKTFFVVATVVWTNELGPTDIDGIVLLVKRGELFDGTVHTFLTLSLSEGRAKVEVLRCFLSLYLKDSWPSTIQGGSQSGSVT